MALLDIKNLRLYYETLRGSVKAVDGVSISIGKGETLALVGESGCGKSSTAYAIMKLVPTNTSVYDGEILFDGENVISMSEEEVRKRIRWRKVSMVFQGAMNALNPVLRVGLQVAEPLIIHEGAEKRDALVEAMKALEEVGLYPDVAYRYPHELSGGMKQRVVIAMALIMKPDLVILDEPTSALDLMTQANITNLLKKLKKELGLAYLFITHDLPLASELADKVAVMYAGKIVELGSAEHIYGDPLHPYTKGLIASVPTLRTEKEISSIPGEVPSLINPPKGCRFHPRCPHRMEICSKEEPPHVMFDEGCYVACWLHYKK